MNLRFFPIYRLAKQLGSSVRELNDKYPSNCLRICITTLEYKVIHNNVNSVSLEHPTSGVVLKLFWPAKVKSVKTGPSFVGRIMRLVTGLSEERPPTA